ncbi:tetratricopeptide repeat protein [Maribacter vaceletii]|uniref:Tetratricopeptide repeat protein n=1 Tax=Maribacter vaceletii TaxID=1206816 RepID=A0A495EDX1_9FLAO|nr:histidine kinase [Maribacter vaceletii]RKR14097.1 tetratricopeptide repeat protein [Maribacter vaceletii]
MQKALYILIVLFSFCFGTYAQDFNSKKEIKGSVKGKENRTLIRNVEVSTNSGQYTNTDSFGEFKIKVAIGDEILFRSPEIETIYYTVKSYEDIDVLVEGYVVEAKKTRSSSWVKSVSEHEVLLDSAKKYKKGDIAKSIDFITQSIASLGKRANKIELAKSLSLLGEVYQQHNQTDLAISSYLDAIKAYKSSKTSLLLGKAYVLNGEYKKAIAILEPLLNIKNLVPFQKVTLYETIGDSYKGLENVNQAVSFYEEGLVIAKKNQIAPKLADLNSKIADAYSSDNRSVEAEGFYTNSLELSEKQAPQRAIQEKEKVADFYNKKNRYDEEIKLRKESLGELNSFGKVKKSKELGGVLADSITSQRINYKIANAYVAQQKYEEAIPYLEKSIVEADVEDDLVVQKDATRKLSEVYKYKGDFGKALETYQEYVKVVDTLYVRKEQEISQAARFNRELASKQSRISGLEQERELSQSKYDLASTEQQLYQVNNKRQKWVIYSLIIGLVLMALAAFFFYRSNQQQKIANNLLALRSLRTQMNPHFIFNALNSVNNYISKNDERSANRYLSDFSTLMRAVLENSDEDFIPFSKELELLELYVKLEHSRFPDKFDYSITVDEKININSFQIPPMLLQPYIENAIWHGLRYKEEKGFLKINILYVSNEVVHIVIVDNGIGRKKSAELKTQNQKKQKSKGMGNIKKRIAILNEMHKDKVDVSISNLQEDGIGTKVQFTLKKE